MKIVKLKNRRLLRNLAGVIIRSFVHFGLVRIIPYKIIKLPNKINGLSYHPSLGSRAKDEKDSFLIASLLKNVPEEYSVRDRDILKKTMLKMGNSCRVILEIGVARNYQSSSTKVLLDHKRKNCRYLGIDVDDKSYLDNKKMRIMTVRTDSGNFQSVRSVLMHLRISSIDILHIDGWHSVSQAIKDWQYSSLVRKGGYIILHDVSVHPGPALLYDAIDQKTYQKRKYFAERKDDWGIAIIRKKL